MALLPRDPLLGFARAFLTFLMGVIALLGAAVTIALPLLILFRDSIVVRITREGMSATPGEIVTMVGIVLALATVLAALAFLFIRHLRRIVDSVALGDPFVPINAQRLRAMAWLSIALQIVAGAAGLGTMWIEKAASDVEAGIDVSIGGVLLPLVLFILARVFRKGAEMREELEGTV